MLQLNEIVDALTLIGLEVEGVQDPAAALRVSSSPPSSRRSRIPMPTGCRSVASIGSGALVQVVCGAPNARAGLKTVFAPPGAVIPASGQRSARASSAASNRAACCVRRPNSGSPRSATAFWSCRGRPCRPRFRAFCRPRRPGHRHQPAAEPSRRHGRRGHRPRPRRRRARPVQGARHRAGRGRLRLPRDAASRSPREDAHLAPAFALRLVRGVKNGPSPPWLQKRLAAIGLRPINALVDITNYLTFDRARPLHVFDAGKVRGDLAVRRARAGRKPRSARRARPMRSTPKWS